MKVLLPSNLFLRRHCIKTKLGLHAIYCVNTTIVVVDMVGLWNVWADVMIGEHIAAD